MSDPWRPRPFPLTHREPSFHNDNDASPNWLFGQPDLLVMIMFELGSNRASKLIAFIKISEDREVFRRPTLPTADEMDRDGSRNAANASHCKFANPRQL